MKIVSVDKVYLYPKHVKELERHGEVMVYKDVPGKREGIERIKEAEIMIDNWFPLPAEVIAAAKKLKFICVASTGYGWVDLEEARKRNIVVSNSPAYSTEAVAEHTIGLMLAAARQTSKAQDDIRQGKWDPPSSQYKGKELKGKTLGIIGYGNIGRRVAKIAKKALEMKILYVNTLSTREDFERLLKKSDVISINAPLTEQTRGMLREKEFQLMKPGVIIVNTGRGAVIDEAVFVENLKTGKIFSAGLDVLVKEPMDKKSPFFSFRNVVITPHIGWNTEEAEYRLSRIATDNVLAFIKGRPQNVVS